ncbi:transglutaminase [Virgibacillus profundi]|uniref:Transglutaminase n=2 Tax=Virgibacillus profundi TaxID=2024555 RepID=A0A2A2ICW0_9BACI|nr:transglutaminase [Virgibacillus profundi]PXY53081.1 transglutaminase family protein [Virgibacillus profundi]
MVLHIKTNNLQAYLEETSIIDYSHPIIQAKVEDFKRMEKTKKELAEIAFYFVRDEIGHSFDLNSTLVTITASETLEQKEGICFAKSHLLAAFLRAMNIPAGFCYQRVTRNGTKESGYALHGLNAIYLEEEDIWFRIDPRGNKAGISSEFSINPEKLAYPIRPKLEEIDYQHVYSDPLEKVITAMKESAECKELFYSRPAFI